MYQNVTEGMFMFLDKKNIQIRLNSTIWNPKFTLPLRILLKPRTVSFRKDKITAKIVSQLKCLEEGKEKDLPYKWKI